MILSIPRAPNTWRSDGSVGGAVGEVGSVNELERHQDWVGREIEVHAVQPWHGRSRLARPLCWKVAVGTLMANAMVMFTSGGHPIEGGAEPKAV